MLHKEDDREPSWWDMCFFLQLSNGAFPERQEGSSSTSPFFTRGFCSPLSMGPRCVKALKGVAQRGGGRGRSNTNWTGCAQHGGICGTGSHQAWAEGSVCEGPPHTWMLVDTNTCCQLLLLWKNYVLHKQQGQVFGWKVTCTTTRELSRGSAQWEQHSALVQEGGVYTYLPVCMCVSLCVCILF